MSKEELALELYEVYRKAQNKQDMPSWEGLDEKEKAVWIEVARHTIMNIVL